MNKNRILDRLAYLRGQIVQLKQNGFNTEKSKQQEEIDYLIGYWRIWMATHRYWKKYGDFLVSMQIMWGLAAIYASLVSMQIFKLYQVKYPIGASTMLFFIIFLIWVYLMVKTDGK